MDAKAREDLDVIRRLMEESRREVVDRGKHFLIWGIVPVGGLLATYARARGGAGPDPLWAWALVLVLGWGASLLVGWRDSRKARVSTLARRILSSMWISVGVTLTLVGVSGLFGGLIPGQTLPGVLSAILAAPIMVTSVLTGQRWLGVVALGWWAGGAVMLFVPGPYALLLMAAMLLLLMAVPGAVLLARAREPGPARAESLS